MQPSSTPRSIRYARYCCRKKAQGGREIVGLRSKGLAMRSRMRDLKIAESVWILNWPSITLVAICIGKSFGGSRCVHTADKPQSHGPPETPYLDTFKEELFYQLQWKIE